MDAAHCRWCVVSCLDKERAVLSRTLGISRAARETLVRTLKKFHVAGSNGLPRKELFMRRAAALHELNAKIVLRKNAQQRLAELRSQGCFVQIPRKQNHACARNGRAGFTSFERD